MLPFKEKTKARERGIHRKRGLTYAVTDHLQETQEIGLREVSREGILVARMGVRGGLPFYCMTLFQNVYIFYYGKIYIT